MKRENKSISFKNQQFYIGIDVHKKNWTATIRMNKVVLKTFSMNPSAKELSEYMQKNYPGGEYLSVYEAGFCGYSIHRELEKEGIKNIIAAPTEIPTSNKEKNEKRDPVDSRKLSRELENESLTGIYIPSQLQQELRSIVRQRFQIIKSQTRLKNQIRGYLHFYGHKLPENYQLKHWSRGFIDYLRNLSFSYSIGKEQLEIYIEELLQKRKSLLRIIKQIRKYIKENGLLDEVLLLCSVPGIGFTTAVVLYTEIMNPGRFSHIDKLSSYIGLIPSIRSTSDKQTVLGIKFHHNKLLRQHLIESAWMAVRNDPALTLAYSNYIRRMSKQEAIIRIAKKLLSRINYVWTNRKPYVTALVK
jgi:transposase